MPSKPTRSGSCRKDGKLVAGAPAPGAERLREVLTQIGHIAETPEGALPTLWGAARRERLDKIAELVREALAAAPPAPHPAQMALEHNRSEVAECVTAMKNTLKNYSWLLDGRGSYEWDDDRYRAEFQTVCTAMQKHVEVLARIAADWSNCPEELEDILAARGDRHASAERVRLTGTQVLEAMNEVCDMYGIGRDFPATWVDSNINFNKLAEALNKRASTGEKSQ